MQFLRRLYIISDETLQEMNTMSTYVIKFPKKKILF